MADCTASKLISVNQLPDLLATGRMLLWVNSGLSQLIIILLQAPTRGFSVPSPTTAICKCLLLAESGLFQSWNSRITDLFWL